MNDILSLKGLDKKFVKDMELALEVSKLYLPEFLDVVNNIDEIEDINNIEFALNILIDGLKFKKQCLKEQSLRIIEQKEWEIKKENARKGGF